MAVFTAVTLDDLTEWLEQFQLGKALAIDGIASGIENSNFFLTTERGAFVLTIFENLGFAQLPFYLQLMKHLAARGIPVPDPVANNAGELVVALHGKPAAIVSKLAGSSQMDPQPVHCAAMGAMLARMHLAAADFPLHQPNLRGLDWWAETAPQVMSYLSAPEAQLLQDEIAFQQRFAATAGYASLPRGPVHADLFRNNVMFDGAAPVRLLRFLFRRLSTRGCSTWPSPSTTGASTRKPANSTRPDVRAMLAAYHAVRPFTAAETQAWQPTAARRRAALLAVAPV